MVASLGILVGKTERVDMAFTRAHEVARLLVRVLDIEFVPDVVMWTYRGEMFPLEIDFEDTELFADAINGTDTDMHEGDDSSAPRRRPGLMLDVRCPTVRGPSLRQTGTGQHVPL